MFQKSKGPIIVGGNGHSGTRLFAEILMASGVNMGIQGYSFDRVSKDLNIRDLMNKWLEQYLTAPGECDIARMKRQFLFRIRVLIPFQNRKWGFKNPRSMFLLPFYHDIFADLKFIHVIRDGRDMSFGNPFVHSPTYWGVLSEEEARTLAPEERMIRFWGEGNLKVRNYGREKLDRNYLMIRFEDICDYPEREVKRITDFIDVPDSLVPDLASLVHKPKSIGRWKQHDENQVKKVMEVGGKYLEEFGYL
jgi:hypothetical protein